MFLFMIREKKRYLPMKFNLTMIEVLDSYYLIVKICCYLNLLQGSIVKG